MLSWEYPPRIVGGISRVVHDLSHKLVESGHKVSVVTYRDGEFEQITFKDGIFKERKLGKSKRHSGTIVTWSPDPQFFAENAPDMNMLKAHFEVIAALCPKLTIEFDADGDHMTFQEQGGLNSYVDRKVKSKELFSNRFATERTVDVTYFKPKKYPGLTLKDTDFKDGVYNYDRTNEIGWDHIPHKAEDMIVTIKKSECEQFTRQEKLNICMTYTSDYSENIDAYVNLGHTDAGAHIQAFHTAFVRAINKYATDAGWLKKNDKNFNSNEISEGLYVAFNMTTTTAKYEQNVNGPSWKIQNIFSLIRAFFGKTLLRLSGIWCIM